MPTDVNPFIREQDAMLVILMGVSGSGKSTIGRLLADRVGWPFLEADDFHPEVNRQKLAAGTPLTDEDRWPWLEALNRGLLRAVRKHGSVILACSALKDVYRDRLDEGLNDVRWVHLIGDPEVLAERLKHRVGHFSSAKILPSQFATLEPPESAVEVEVDGSPARVVEEVAQALGVAQIDTQVIDRLVAHNVLVKPRNATRSQEWFEDLTRGGTFRVERIVSLGQATPDGDWYDQDGPEWVLLLAGKAKLRFERDDNPYDLEPGDAWLIPAHCRHRVEWTDPDHPTIWLALHFQR